MAQVDAKLVSSLKLAKSSPMFFAFIAKGQEGKLLVDKRKISAKDAAEAKKECGGGSIVKGRCHGEEGKMIFEVGTEVAATLSALTKKIIKHSAGMTFEVEYRFAADLAAEEGQAAPPGDGTTAPAPTAPSGASAEDGAAPAGTVQDDLSAIYKKNLDDWLPAIKAGLVAKGQNAAAVAKLLNHAKALSTGGSMAQAIEKLSECHKLALLATGEVSAKGTSQAESGGEKANWLTRREAVNDRYLQAIKEQPAKASKLRASLAAADGKAELGEFGQALKVLGHLESLLEAPAETDGKAAAELQQWQAAYIEVRNQVRKLQAVIVQAKDTNSNKAVLQLESIVKNLASQPTTQQDVAELERWISDDELIAMIASPNPLGLEVKIADRLLPVLSALKPHLEA